MSPENIRNVREDLPKEATRQVTLECELLDRERFRLQADARLAVFDIIEGRYNPRCRQSALDCLSP